MTNILDGLLSSLGRASWQGALAFLFVWLFCRVLARRLTADAHCWLWRLGYVKLLVGLLWGGAVLLPLLSPAPPPVAAQAPPMPVAYQQHPMVPSEAGAVLPASVGPVVGPRLGWQAGLAIVYAFGVAVCLGRLLLAARKTRRILRHTAPNVTEWETACAAALARAMGLRQIPALARSAEVDSPVLIAGRVLLPSEARYGEDALRMILAHELAHARRRDLLWEWLGTAVQVVFFFHPLIVLARREERLAREAAADALALRTTGAAAADYGSLLLSLSMGQSGPRPTLVGAVGVIEGGSPLRRRLLALRDGVSGMNPRRPRWRIALTLVPLLALVFVPWQMTHGQAPPPVAPIPAMSVPNGSPSMPAGDKRIVGVIRDGMGKPVRGLNVNLDWHWSQAQRVGGLVTGTRPVANVATDAHGRFAISRLPAGDFDYGVTSSADQYVAVGGLLVISEAEAQKTLNITVSTGSIVTGRVVGGQSSKPMAGVVVAVRPAPHGDAVNLVSRPLLLFVMTNAQGRYQVRVMPGEVFVEVGRTDDGTARTRRIRLAVQRVSVHLGQTASAPDLAVSLHPMIVFTGPDGQPVANTPVAVTPTNVVEGNYILDVPTDDTGAIALDHFDSGSFRIAKNGRYASGTFHCSPDGSVEINVDGRTTSYPSGVGTVHIAEGSVALLMGNVVDESGAPIPSALVNVYEIDPKRRSEVGKQSFRTDAAGVFHALLDPNGRYLTHIRADGFNQVSVSDEPLTLAKGATANPGTVPLARVDAGDYHWTGESVTYLGTIHLVRANGFVAGRVVDSAGNPKAGVVASVNGAKTGVSAALTDAQGRFRIPNVVPGEALHLILCLKGEVHDSGEALYQSNEQMDFSGVQASPTEREIVWRPHSGGY